MRGSPGKFRLPTNNLAGYSAWPSPAEFPFSPVNSFTSFSDLVYVTNSNPNWKQMISRKQDATGIYKVSGFEGSRLFNRSLSTSVPLSNGVPFNSWNFTTHVDMPSYTFGKSNVALRNIALTRIKRKISSEVEQMKALVPILEFKDLNRTIRSATALTLFTVKTLLDIKKTRGRSALRYASQAWLTYGFGIRPMLADIDQSIRSIQSRLNRTDRKVRFTASASTDWKSGFSSPGTTANRLGSVGVYLDCHHSLSYRFVAGFDLNLRSGNNYNVEDQFGLTFPDVLPALWEAAAFSWVADYFVNVGDYLEDTFSTPPGICLYVSENRRYVVSHSGSLRRASNAGSVILTETAPLRNFKYFEFERLPHAALPHRSLSFKMVDEVGKFGVTKLLNLASLLVK